MKKYSFLFLMCGFFPAANAQLTVKPNSYLYAKNTVVYVKQNINLENDSNIYLRNESQLVQGTDALPANSVNSGQGRISVFQEGKANQYAYNYWCSPVGNVTGGSGNTTFNISLLKVPTGEISSNPATILPVNNFNGVAAPGSLSIAQRYIYKFISSSSYSSWIGPNPTMNPGEGFSMKGVGGTDPTIVEGNGVQNNPGNKQRYEFSGRPNNGDIIVPVVAGQRTLTGNPYPSALDMNAFLIDNLNCTGIAYYWEQDPNSSSHTLINYRGGYGTYSPIERGGTGIYVPATYSAYDSNGVIIPGGPSSGLVIDRRYAPIGQGFKIEGATTGNVTIKNAHRAYEKENASGSTFQRLTSRGTNNESNQEEEETVSIIRINTAINNAYARQIALAFLQEATDGVDRGIDAITRSDLPNDVSFLLNNDAYIIQGLQFDVNKKIPLVIKSAANSTFKFTIGEIKNFDTTQDIYLHDILNNTFHNLKTSDYTVNISTAGTFKDRFEITFKTSNELLSNNNFNKNSFSIVQNNTSKTLTIYNPESADIKSVVLYDITGKLFSQYNNLGTKASYQFPTSGMSTGVYLVKLIDTTNKTFTQKIIINETK